MKRIANLVQNLPTGWHEPFQQHKENRPTANPPFLFGSILQTKASNSGWHQTSHKDLTNVISCNYHLHKNPTNIWHICGRYYVCNIVYKYKRKKVIQCLHMFVSWSQKNTISWTIPSPSHLDNISSKHSWLQRHEVPTLSKTLKLMTFASTSFCLKKEAVFWRFWVNLIHWKWMKEQMLGARKCSV